MMIALFVVTILSVAVAIVMSVIAWRVAREERRRSEARVQVLAADIHDIHDEQSSPVVVSDSFLAAAHSRRPSPFLAALAVGVLVVGSTLGALVFIAGGGSTSSATGLQPATMSQPGTLELTTLDHERAGNRLIVRGVVRNRNAAGFRDPITVVVAVLDRDGTVVATGRAPVEIAAEPNASGVESSFVVTIAGVGDVDRYRVRFSSGDRTLAHVDRRDQTATAELR